MTNFEESHYTIGYKSVLKNLHLGNVTHIQNLTNYACIAAYGGSFVTSRTHLFAVSPDPNPPGNNSVLSVLFPPTIKRQNTGEGWVCASSATEWTQDCQISTIEADSSRWEVWGYPIVYCLSQQVEEICRFEFSMQLLIAVILCNLIKAICMAITIWQQKVPTLVTIGDAISSFLDSPDPTTIKHCMMSRIDVVRGRWRRQKRSPVELTSSQDLLSRAWSPKQKRWFSAASGRRWFICISL